MFRSTTLVIHETQRGLRYVDGVFDRELAAGAHRIPCAWRLGPYRRPVVSVRLVDLRERDLTIKGQEILSADKVALRVSVVVQFRVVEPQAALHRVEDYSDRIYTDVQLAARRSLASMSLDDILTNRNRLSDDILADVKETAESYGVEILRAAVKDLVFPGNLQEIMNRVLAAERTCEAELIEARARAERERIEAETTVASRRLETEALAAAKRELGEAEAAAHRVRKQAELDALREQQAVAAAFADDPALLRLRELEALAELAQSANARIYIGFDKHLDPPFEGGRGPGSGHGGRG